MPVEPSIQQFDLTRRSERIKRAIAATRPAFLTASLIPVTVAFSLMQQQIVNIVTNLLNLFLFE